MLDIGYEHVSQVGDGGPSVLMIQGKGESLERKLLGDNKGDYQTALRYHGGQCKVKELGPGNQSRRLISVE